MKLIRKITERVARRNPIKYARKIGVKVGNECRFTGNPRWGSEPWLIQVGNHVLLSAEVNFITHDAGTFLFRDTEEYKDVFKFAPIVIHDNCFIGMRSTLLPGIEIGPNSVVAAGSVVTRSVPPGEVWGGILLVSYYDATVRAAFMPDSTLEFLPIFSSLKCTKSSVFSYFPHS